MSFLKSCLETLLKPADDPRQSAAYTYERQRVLLVKVRGLLVDIENARQQHSDKTAVLTLTINELETHATTALKNGREHVARQKLQQQQLAITEQQMQQTRMSDLDREAQRLLLVKQRLVSQIETYLARREELLARYSNAESQVQLNKALQTIFRDLADTDQIVERAETRTEQMEARASLLNEDIEHVYWPTETVAFNLATETALSPSLNLAVESKLAQLKDNGSSLTIARDKSQDYSIAPDKSG